MFSLYAEPKVVRYLTPTSLLTSPCCWILRVRIGGESAEDPVSAVVCGPVRVAHRAVGVVLVVRVLSLVGDHVLSLP